MHPRHEKMCPTVCLECSMECSLDPGECSHLSSTQLTNIKNIKYAHFNNVKFFYEALLKLKHSIQA